MIFNKSLKTQIINPKTTSKLMSKPLLTIGLPVYNGENTIPKLIDSLVFQTFRDFTLVISDNASTDSTQKICENFVKKDPRIKYIKQQKNIGLIKNWNFILEDATTKYFMWVEADDYYHPDFIKKNIQILESNENFVGSTDNIIFFDGDTSPQAIHSIGSYEQKAIAYLKFNKGGGIFAIYRTKELQRSIVYVEHAAWDLQLMLNILKFGDLNVINENLHYRSSKGISSKSNIAYEYSIGLSIPKIIFPYLTTTIFCLREFGIMFFFKNFSVFLRLNGNGAILRTKDFFKLCKYNIWNKK